MARRWIWLFGVVLTGFIGAQDPDPQRGVSVVEQPEELPTGRLLVAAIGIDDYRHWQRLDNAVSDAVGFQNALVEKAGFTVVIEPLLNQDATKGAILGLIEDRLRQEVQPDDQLVLFFAGHGHTRVSRVGDHEVETGYLVPVEAPSGQDQQWSAYLRIDQFLDAVNLLPARHILVILDACHSGFALGPTIEKTRGADEFRRELSRNVSRRAITSAKRDQRASDRGPLPHHSLFTGSFVDGLTWGKIDLDGNGLITSSEIGLYLQQTVGQATGSQQTPDFGAFGLDDRGELVISLQNQSFSALTARATNALHHGRYGEFSEFIGELAQLRPNAPETLYLRYRQGLLTGNIDAALEAVTQLADSHFEIGAIPLGSEDLWDLRQQLPFWRQILELPERPTEITAEVVLASGETVQPVPLGEILVSPVPAETNFRLRITNQTAEQRFVHLFLISEAGRMRPIRLWERLDQIFSGMKPGETWESIPLQKPGATGIEELRLVVAPANIEELVIPPDAKSRAALHFAPASVEAITRAHRHTIRLVPTMQGPEN